MSEPASPPPDGRTSLGARKTADADGSPESAGWAIFGYLLSGMAVYGGLGWLLGHWVGDISLCFALGMIVGLGLAIALVIFRYGRP